MSILPKDLNGCPYLLLAPMEGVGDSCFRKAISTVGGFDEAVRDFLRVPSNAHVKSLAVEYNAKELDPIPLAAQLMGSDPDLLAAMAQEIEKRGAPRIDLNCGCPSNTVTGRGAGSSLLKEPDFLYENAKALVNAVKIPVTLKMRSGFEDTSLFKENLLAAQESGVRYITLHPRTKVDGYGPPAKWELIAEAKSLLKIPVVGNGDILTVDHAIQMLHMTGCDGLMIGRGSIINPFLFKEIRAHFAGQTYRAEWHELSSFLQIYLNQLLEKIHPKVQVNKLKQLFSFLFKRNNTLLNFRNNILTSRIENPISYLDHVLPYLKESFI